MLSSNQIVRFFNHQYLQKKSVNLLDFFQADSDQWKWTYDYTNFSWVRSGFSVGRGVSGWFKGNRQVKIVQNESLMNYIPDLQ